MQFVSCIILLAFDFWTVKNITGRLLVGLRWWSYVQENGQSEWVFESLEDMVSSNYCGCHQFVFRLIAFLTARCVVVLSGGSVSIRF